MPIRHVLVVGLLCGAGAACTSTEPPVETLPPKTGPSLTITRVESEPAAELAEPVEAVQQSVPWQWDSPRPVGKLEIMKPMPVHVDNGPIRVEARALPSGGVQVEQTHSGHREWTTSLGDDADSGAAALAWAGDVVVAHYNQITSGAILTRLSGEDGSVIWEVSVLGLGPIDHSKYYNDVQLQVQAGEIWVYGREAQGSYVEVHGLEDGLMSRHSLVDHVGLDVDWSAPRPRPRDAEEHFVLPAAWTIERKDGALSLTYAPPGGAPLTTAMPNDFERCNVGMGMEHDGVLYLAHACSITSGSHLYAFSFEDQRAWLWKTDLVGVGPIAHSAYSNILGVRWVRGRVVVDGDEAMGRYVETVDPENGKTLVTRRFPVGG